MLEKIIEFIKNHALMLSVLFIFILLVVLFHEVMTPFVIALIVVYLMEPLVSRMNQKGIGKRKFPRWCAVITAYFLFFACILGVGFAFIPSLASEISQATEALPNYFTRVKNEDIPRWSARVDRLMFKLNLRDTKDVRETVQIASDQMAEAWKNAYREFDIAMRSQGEVSLPFVDTSGEQPLLKLGVERNSKKQVAEVAPAMAKAKEQPDESFIKLVRGRNNDEYYIVPGENNIIIEPDAKGTYTLKFARKDQDLSTPNAFNLEQELSKFAGDLIESSTHYAGSALTFLQYTIQAIINMFVQIILVFMLAAFLSIDQPKMMAKFRKLFASPDGSTDKFDELLSRLSKGLGGVIRGQLLICCINGTLTGIGLWIFGVDFAMLLGIIAGVLSIVPIFGTVISTIPAVLLGLVQGFTTAVLVLAWILLVHFCDTNFFTPKIVGSTSSLHPVVIIFALLAGQQSFGALGLILAVPVASICQTLFVFAMDQSKNKRKAEALALAGGGVVADMDGSEASHEESGDVALVAAVSGSETTTASADLPKPSTEPETRQDMEQTQKEA